MKEERSKKSTVVLLPCEDYNEETVYEKLKEGLSLLGGVEQFLSKKKNIVKTQSSEKMQRLRGL